MSLCLLYFCLDIPLWGKKENYLCRYQQLPKTRHHADKDINPAWKQKLGSASGCLFPKRNQDHRELKFNTRVNMRRILCVLLTGSSSCFGLEQC